jgi:hypothetical protein
MLPPEIGSAAPAALKLDRSSEIMTLPLRDARELFERQYLEAQLLRFGGNISRTANFVGMERSALHRKLKFLGVQAEDRSATAWDGARLRAKVAHRPPEEDPGMSRIAYVNGPLRPAAGSQREHRGSRLPVRRRHLRGGPSLSRPLHRRGPASRTGWSAR